METRIERCESTDGKGFLEVATVMHDGREFTAQGASFHQDHGGLVYVQHEPVTGKYRNRLQLHGTVRTFAGDQLGVCSISVYPHNFGGRFMAVRASIGGREYHGRASFDWGECVTLRPCVA